MTKRKKFVDQQSIDSSSRLRRLAWYASTSEEDPLQRGDFTSFCNRLKQCRTVCEGTGLAQEIDDRGRIVNFGDLWRAVEALNRASDLIDFIEEQATASGVGPRQKNDDRFLAKINDPGDGWTDFE